MRKFAFVAGALAFVEYERDRCGRWQSGGRGLCSRRLQLVGRVLRRPCRRRLGRRRHHGDCLADPFGGSSLLSGTQSHDTSGWLAGVQLGAMKQFGSFVVGTEFSLSGADINGSGRQLLRHHRRRRCGIVANCHTNINWLLTGLAKAGFARDRWMVYGALGYAVAGVDHSITLTVGPAAGELVAAGCRPWRRLRGRLRLCALEGLHVRCAVPARQSGVAGRRPVARRSLSATAGATSTSIRSRHA